MKKDMFQIGGKKIKSRLIVGTGKYKSFKETSHAVKAFTACEVSLKLLYFPVPTINLDFIFLPPI